MSRKKKNQNKNEKKDQNDQKKENEKKDQNNQKKENEKVQNAKKNWSKIDLGPHKEDEETFPTFTENNCNIVDVPSDGNCGYYCLSLGYTRMGKECPFPDGRPKQKRMIWFRKKIHNYIAKLIGKGFYDEVKHRLE